MAPVSVVLVALALIGVAQAWSPIGHSDFLADDEDVTPLNDYRLDGSVIPRHYNLRVSPEFENFGYTGRVIIDCVATQGGVIRITLNSEGLNIMTATVVASGSTVNIIEGAVVRDDTLNYIHINLASPLVYNPTTEQVYVIDISFQGTLRDDMYGFYRSWYMHDNSPRWMATTQFQATSARAAFPCFDEPSYKATFDISIERPVGYSSWSNMRLDRTETPVGGRPIDYFYRTPVMSTYLLAFIVAEYSSSPVNNDDNELLHEVIARPNVMPAQGVYALEMGQRLLAQMDTHTGIPFDGMADNIKMTQAAIPDFSAGAMENWGLLTYREAYLMYHPDHTNRHFQQIIAYILSHEIAHMWFGNLVTCEWWDVLWLNEGFARYYQYYLTHSVDPTMGFDTRFIVEQVHSSLLADSADNAHPLTDPSLDSPSSVSNHFSTITYNKGAAIIRMTEHLLGSDVNRQGLENYLREKSFQTAVPSDLFRHLDAVGASSGALAAYGSGFTIDEYYRTWTEQAGYPVLNVNVNHQTGDMYIRQWLFDQDVGYSSTARSWIIPVTFASEGNPFTNTKPTHIIRDTVTIINRGTIGDHWVVFNIQQTGFYRVNYDDYTWGLILRALREDHTQIHEYNRAQIVDDVCQFARAGMMDYTRALNILSYLENEIEYAPWIAAINCMGYLRRRFIGRPLQAEFESTIASWSDNVMEGLTYTANPGESWMRSYLRYQMSIYLCGLGVRACRDAAVEQFAQLTATPSVEVAPDNRQWVYCNALREGGAAEFNVLWERFRTIDIYTEKMMMLGILGCTTDVPSLHTFLNSIMSDTTTNYEIRAQDYASSMNSAIGSNEENTLIVFQWLQNEANWAQYIQHFPNNPHTHLNTIASRLTNEADVQLYETWVNSIQGSFTANQLTSLRNNIALTRTRFAWTDSITGDVGSYIEDGNQEVELTTPQEAEPTDPPTTAVPPEVEPPVVPEWDGGGAASITTSFITVLLALAAGVFANRQ